MSPRTVEAGLTPRDAVDGEAMLRLALSEPRRAVEQGERLLANRLSHVESSYVLQSLSVAYRELSDGPAALRCARRALRAAARSGQDNRVADVRATLGATLASVGRNRDAIAALNTAVPRAVGVDAARIRVRRGGVLHMLGRVDDALDDLRAAIPVLRAAGDVVYEARALNWRALAYDALGQHARADHDLARSEELLRAAGQQLESIWARHNRGHLAFRTGNFPAALRHYDAAEAMYETLGEPEAELELDRCRVLLAAGMPELARDHAAAAVQILTGRTAVANARAEALLTAASAGLAAGELETSLGNAREAARLFRRQQRDRWFLRARRTALTARWLAGERAPAMLRSAQSVADGLSGLHDHETADAQLLAGRIALGLGRTEVAQRRLTEAAHCRVRGPAMSRATGWLAKALQSEASGDSRAMLAACRRGLDLLDDHRLTMGATEMRARATVHGAELAGIAVRHAASSHNARQLLQWSERWRATTLTAAPVRPPDDDELAAELSALRDATARLTRARAEGGPTIGLEREQARLEHSVRARTLRTSGVSDRADSRLDVQRLRAVLGPATLLDLVEVEDSLHVVTVGPRGVRMHPVGASGAAVTELEFARFGLRRAAVATGAASSRMAMAALETASRSLQAALLGPAAEWLGDDEVVVVPPGRLHAVPWALMPALRERPVTVAPSIASWLRASTSPAPHRRKVTLVAGPDLETEGAEVQVAADLYEHSTLLTGPAASANDVLSALDGASLAHIAAHGSFRADNALFSSLQMSDGPLTVHDLQRLHHAPYRLVLSSCDSGLGTAAGADELLGLASALIGLGTAGLLASVVPVNDRATVPLMIAVHERLRAGDTLARALHTARGSLDDDPLERATGWSFVALGGA